MALGRQVDIAVLQFTASYEADRLSFRCWLSYYSFNSQPHTRLTTAAPNNVPLKRPFNSQPHTRLTTCPSKKAKILNLSIHSLIRGWPRELDQNLIHQAFQFTASYGADQFFQSYFLLFLYPFNSQPHTRLTLHRRNNIVLFAIFQFTASYEADHFTLYVLQYTYTFNSQPHTRLTLL